MPACTDLFALFEREAGVYVDHLIIDDSVSPNEQGTLINRVSAFSGKTQLYHNTVEQVEALLINSNPDALVVRLPFSYCNERINANLPCLASTFSRAYMQKKAPDIDHPLNS
jgi:hypothetical protein